MVKLNAKTLNLVVALADKLAKKEAETLADH